MARKKRYEEGGDIEVANASDDPIGTLNKLRGWTETGEESSTRSMAPAAEKKQSFKEAFASARGAGDKTFEWNGKKYTTEMASSKPAKVTDTGDETSRLTARMPKPALKYQSLQDREIEAESKRRAEGRTFYGTNKMKMPEREERKPLALKSTKSESGYTGMGSLKFSKGGSTASRRADGIAQKGKTRGKIC
jgi:hypothetical protein